MIVKGWSNGSPNLATGAGYGVTIDRRDRDTQFRRNWATVALELEAGERVSATLSPAFWKGCGVPWREALWVILQGALTRTWG